MSQERKYLGLYLQVLFFHYQILKMKNKNKLKK